MVTITVDTLFDHFVDVVIRNFPTAYLDYIKAKDENSPRLETRRNIMVKDYDKRWIVLDKLNDHLSIVMDFRRNDLTESDLQGLGLRYGQYEKNISGIRFNKNRDHVKITVSPISPYNFDNDAFIRFLHKHHASYMQVGMNPGMFKNGGK